METRRGSRRFRLTGPLVALGGIALLVWSVRQGGATAVIDGVQRVGAAGITIVCLLGGLRGLIRAAAWRLCLDREHRATLRSVFTAYLSGDAIGNVTPFGLFISEPSKIALLRPRIDVEASIAALAVENLFYSATVVIVLIAGTAALLMSFEVSQPVKVASLWHRCAGSRVGLRRSVDRLNEASRQRRRRVDDSEGNRHAVWSKHLPSIRRTGDLIFGFVSRRRRAVLPLLALELCYHTVAVLETWYTIDLITGARPGLLTAFVLEYVNRSITVAFQFVPMSLGVDEAGKSLATNALGLGSAAGVSLALVRKARIVIWTAIGLGLLATSGRRGRQMRPTVYSR